MRRSSAAFLATVAAVGLGAGRASAWCRSAVCSEDPSQAEQVCDPTDPATPTGCTPIYWYQPCVSFDVQQDASNQVDWATADKTLQQAFDTWLAVDCGGGHPSITVADFGPVECDEVEYNHDGYEGNANILVFRDQFWPHNGGLSVGTDTLALTTVTYDEDTNQILDADIEVNTAENTFTTNDSPGAGDTDLLSVLTHETGHFLGLAHTQSPNPATMAPVYPGGISMRTLAADDMAAVCNAYPPDRTNSGDDSCIPRHGWAPQCGAEQDYGTCAVGRGVDRAPKSRAREAGVPEGGVAASLAVVAALGAWTRRRRRR